MLSIQKKRNVFILYSKLNFKIQLGGTIIRYICFLNI
jgi:hypothetical protein